MPVRQPFKNPAHIHFKVSSPHPRLLIILNRLVIGGQAVDTLPLAFHLANHFNILVVYGEKEKDEIEASFLLQNYPGLRLKKISHLKRSINPFSDLAAFWQLLVVIHTFKPALVHTHGAKSGLLGRLAAFVCRVPVKIHTFHGHFFHSYFNKFVTRLTLGIEKLLVPLTTGFVVLSPAQLNDLVHVFKVLPLQKTALIPLGFSMHQDGQMPEKRAGFRQRYSLSKDDVAIGLVGRIVPIKNHAFFVQVIERLLKTPVEKRAAFFIVGDGEMRQRVETLLMAKNILYNTTGITPRVRVVFTSWIEDISQVMSGLDIIALTSLNEGTPLSLIEAQAFGKPVVATNVGGVKDTLIPGETGFLVANHDVDSFCARLLELADNPFMRVDMGRKGQQFVRQQFSKQREVEQTRDFYRSCLRKKNILLEDLNV